MRNLYKTNPQALPRLDCDSMFADYENKYCFSGIIDRTFKFIENFQLINPKLWKRFVNQFREDDADYDEGWRGEYWGKMMRGASLVYSYTRNPELYSVLSETVSDMIESADEDGRISSYKRNHEFDGWDMWSRKYVLLGMQYFLEICEDESLAERIIESMCRQADYIIKNIGKTEEGKKSITSATRYWRGLNSSSILEPIVRLYMLTGDKRYFDFATYIVECGGTDVENIFELAYNNDFLPYQYPVTKAYEMTSCFEGLLEYYRINKEPRYKTAIVNFAECVLKTDFTVIGGSGCTHELFDYSTARQANTTNMKIMQETCVTVTLMKFFYQLNLLTADPKYIDAFERSLYNAYLGAVNTERVIEPMIKTRHPDWNIEPLPFDSYSPLTAGTRGNGIGGLKLMSDNHYYGCCACIGSAGIGLVPKVALMTTERGLALNLFIDGRIETKTPSGAPFLINIKTDYPVSGKIELSFETEANETFELLIRNPEWSKTTKVKLSGKTQKVCNGYIPINTEWTNDKTVTIDLDMRTQAILPIPYGSAILMNKSVWIDRKNFMVQTFDREDPLAHRHIALRRGPIMLAQEQRLGYSVDDPISILISEDGYVDVSFPKKKKAPYEAIIELKVPLTNGRSLTVTDYASAGKLWTEESKMAVWMLTK